MQSKMEASLLPCVTVLFMLAITLDSVHSIASPVQPGTTADKHGNIRVVVTTRRMPTTEKLRNQFKALCANTPKWCSKLGLAKQSRNIDLLSRSRARLTAQKKRAKSQVIAQLRRFVRKEFST